jgi:nucleoid DNA-binding protein
MATITKKDLIERITERTKLKRGDAKKAIQEFLDQVIVELKKGNRLEFRDFGVFEVTKRAVKFKVGRLMRESVELDIQRNGVSPLVEIKTGAKVGV